MEGSQSLYVVFLVLMFSAAHDQVKLPNGDSIVGE